MTKGPKQAPGATAQIRGEPPGRMVRGQGGASPAGGAASQRSPLQWLACGGVTGPVLFTAAWVISSLRQAGHPPAQVQLSGLAAMDARDPQIMIAGFAALGAGTLALGAEVLIAARLLGLGRRGTGRPGTGQRSRWLTGPGRWGTGRAGPWPGEEP